MALRSVMLAWAVCPVLITSMADTAFAHHSFGMFDMQKTVTIEGTVKEFQWTNPHVWIDVTVSDPKTKQPVAWGVEADSINILKSRGWIRTSLSAGDKITLVIHPLKTGAIGGSLVSASVNGQPIGTPGGTPPGGNAGGPR